MGFVVQKVQNSRGNQSLRLEIRCNVGNRPTWIIHQNQYHLLYRIAHDSEIVVQRHQKNHYVCLCNVPRAYKQQKQMQRPQSSIWREKKPLNVHIEEMRQTQVNSLTAITIHCILRLFIYRLLRNSIKFAYNNVTEGNLIIF